MKFLYGVQALEDLKKLEPFEAHMLLDLFENQYTLSESLNETGKVFKTGPFRILFIESDKTVTIFRVIK